MTTAQTILQQLGGNKFAVMTGAKNFSATADTLMFKLPSNFAKNGINHLTITLTPDDLYEMKFLKVRGTSIKQIEVMDGVYCEDLQRVFTSTTGLDTYL